MFECSAATIIISIYCNTKIRDTIQYDIENIVYRYDSSAILETYSRIADVSTNSANRWMSDSLISRLHPLRYILVREGAWYLISRDLDST